MSFLGLSSGAPSESNRFLQDADVAVARNVAVDVALKNRIRRMRGGMSGLGAAPTRGTRAWWIWYATVYLPQYYSQAKVQRYIYASPYYAQFGSPYQSGYGYPYQQPYTPYQYPYSTYNYPQYTNNYPYYGYGSSYYDPFTQAQYTNWQGEQGSAACAAQGGYWDPTQMSCNAITGQQPYGSTVYGPTGTPPNVIGLPEWQAVAMLNAAGFNVWELNRDGVSQGVPPGYASNRVDISISNGVVTAAAVG